MIRHKARLAEEASEAPTRPELPSSTKDDFKLTLSDALADLRKSDPAEKSFAEKIIRELDDPEAEVRENASRRANNFGVGGYEAIREALKRDDLSPEVRLRLRSAMKFLEPRVRRIEAWRQRFAFERVAFHQGYTEARETDRAWNAQAHAAIDLFMKLDYNPKFGPPELRERAMAALKDVVMVRGCGDRMLLAMYAIAIGQDLRSDEAEVVIGLDKFVAVLKEKYPPVVKMRLAVARLRIAPKEARQTSGPVTVLPDLANTPGLPPTEIDTLAEALFPANVEGNGLKGEWDKFQALYEKIEPNSPGPLLTAADDDMASAIYGRRFGQFNGPKAAGYFDLLDAADKALTRAWSLDPQNGRTALLMMRLQTLLAERANTDAEFETWFNRAMEADPDNYDACVEKLRRLEDESPKGLAAVLDFGRRCLATQNWRGGIPAIVLDAHEYVAAVEGDRQVHYAKPEVWRDIKAYFEGQLANFSDDVRRRCEYAKYASQCGQWAVVARQLELVGDHPVIEVFGSDESYRYLRRKAARLAKGPSPAEPHKNVKPAGDVATDKKVDPPAHDVTSEH